MGVCTGCHGWSKDNGIKGLECVDKLRFSFKEEMYIIKFNFDLKFLKEGSDTVAGLIHLCWTLSGPHLYGRRHSSESVWSRLDLSGLHPSNK